jgi:hypothetical protein
MLTVEMYFHRVGANQSPALVTVHMKVPSPSYRRKPVSMALPWILASRLRVTGTGFADVALDIGHSFSCNRISFKIT